MLRDIRHAARVLLQAKGWTTVVVISLALGIGANTALFSAINGLLLKRIPVQDPDSLVRLRWSGKNDMVTSSSDYGFSAKDDAGREVRTTFSYPMYKQFLADNRTMTDLLACAPFGRVSVVVDGQAEIADAFLSTGNYYRVLGINASLGRTLVPEDDTPSAPPAAVISRGSDGSGHLAIDDQFDRAWRRVGLALDRVGFTVEDSDRSKGLYYVRYVDPQTDAASKEPTGVLAKLAFWRSTPEAKDRTPQYRIAVKGGDPGSEVNVLNNDGQVERTDTGYRILSLLYEQLK